MISSQKLVFWGLIALVFVGGWWYLAPWDGESQTPAAEPLPAPSMAPSNQTVPGPSPIGTVVTEAPTSVGPLNWGMYSGTMQDQVQKALTERNGPMAADLAAMLQECLNISRMHAFKSSRGGNSSGDPAIEALGKAMLQEEQRQISYCQAVGGDHQQVRLQLLMVAVEQNVFGAADTSFQAGVRTPDVLKQLVRDARQGSLGSLFHVATYNARLFGIDAEAQSAVRYALKIASADPTVGSRVVRLLEFSEHLAPGYADESSATYDYSKMSETARKEGADIAARLVKQLMKPKP